MVEVVAHHGCGIVEQVGDLVVVLAGADDLGKELDVVAPAGLNELLFDRCALDLGVRFLVLGDKRRDGR